MPDTAEVRLPRRWRHTVSAEGLLAHDLTDTWTAWAGGGFQSNAVPDATIDGASPDGDRFVGLAGAAWRLSSRWQLSADLEVQRIRPREVVASEHDLANGTYRLTLWSAGVHARWTRR